MTKRFDFNSQNAHTVRDLCAVLLIILVFGACQSKQESNQQVSDVESNSEAPKTADTMSKGKHILFFGNSLTAGYMLEEEQSFPSLIQKRLDSMGLDYNVINAGLSGETTAAGAARIDWVLQQRVDIFVLELGANDALRGLSVTETETNLRNILEKVRQKNPETALVIAGMLAPPNMGSEYTNVFNGIFSRLAKEFDAGLVPFLLDGVAADPALNLGDGIHPNVEGQKIVMENVWGVLKNYLS